MSSSTGEDPTRPKEPPVDLEVLREATVGDRDLMQELADLYVNDADLQLRALEDALSNGELDRIRRIGAALGRASREVGAAPAAGVFRQLEEAARDGDLDRVRAAITAGRSEFVRVRRSLADLR